MVCESDVCVGWGRPKVDFGRHHKKISTSWKSHCRKIFSYRESKFFKLFPSDRFNIRRSGSSVDQNFYNWQNFWWSEIFVSLKNSSTTRDRRKISEHTSSMSEIFTDTRQLTKSKKSLSGQNFQKSGHDRKKMKIYKKMSFTHIGLRRPKAGCHFTFFLQTF